MSDGEEGNTSDHSNSPDELADKLEDRLAEKLDDLLSQTPDIPIDISSHSDGLSDKECAVRRVKTQMSLGKLCVEERDYEVGGPLGATHTGLFGVGMCLGPSGLSSFHALYKIGQLPP